MDYENYKQKTAILKNLAYHYYVLDSPIASDEEYDRLYRELIEFEAQNPQLIDKSSPTQRVGDILSENFPKISHIFRMWSLEDAFNLNEIKAFILRANRALDSNISSVFMCDAKFDGASLNLIYENGELISAATRGDGSVGEGVLNNIRAINSIPLFIPYKNKIEIRGEVVIKKSDFNALNEARLQSGENLFANPRNAASGSLRQKDSKIVRERKLKFIPWGFGACEIANDSYFEVLNEIKKFGFIDTKLSKICTNIEEIEEFYQYLISVRNDYEIMLDGMVVRFDSRNLQDRLSHTAKNPRYAIAYKFPAIEKQTKLNDISLQVGRSGVVTPVAELEPINIDGALISRATLHNFDEIARKDLKIGDTVLVIRSGDVIPKIIKPIIELRDGSQKIIIPPRVCPICESELLIESAFIKCQNLNCKGRKLESIIYFASKKAMNIDGLGEKIIEKLFENGAINNICDIYRLDSAKLGGFEGFKDKKINNILNAIKNSKNPPLWRFISALGIEHIGEGASKKLASEFGLDIFKKSEEDFLKVRDIGKESAQSLFLFFKTNAELLNELLEFIKPQILEQTSGRFSGEIITLTGSMSETRDKISAFLEANGAQIAPNLSKKTTLLIYGQNAGSKLEKAREMGIKTMSEGEALGKN